MSNETVGQETDQTVNESATGNTLLSNQNSEQKSESGNTLLSSQEVTKAEEESKPEDKQVVPETYEAWKLPEGVELNQQMSDDFTVLAKEGKLSQEMAQKFVDLQVKNLEAMQKQNMAEFKETTDGWRSDSIKEFGSNLKQTLAYSRKVLDTFGTPELSNLLEITKLGDHPEVIKFTSKLGKLLGEDKFGEGQKRAPQKSLGEIFYPDMYKN